MKIKSNFKEINNDTQKEALINEIKGNLFEFLVAHNCAKSLNVEASFLKGIDLQMKSMLQNYEKWLRINDKELVLNLAKLAKSCADELVLYLREFKEPINIILLGKIAGHEIDFNFHEADFIIQYQNQNIPISLKLSKKNAYVNTKSAGIKSFISTYFKNFEFAQEKQKVLNDIVDNCFEQMGRALYAARGLEFVGRFDELWDGPDLPGELAEADHIELTSMYQQLSQNLYSILQEFYAQSDSLFVDALMPLMGVGDDSLIQVTCYYKNKDSYEFDRCEIKAPSLNGAEVEFLPFKTNTSSFEIMVDKLILQIRIKPMNKFTTPSYKVNCSVRSQLHG